MRYIKFKITGLIMELLLISTANAQDISNLNIRKGIKATGGVTLSNIIYHTSDTIARRDPYQLIMTANLNLNLFGYEAPFSFTFSNSQHSYTQPFNRVSFSPQYKWIKTYAGVTSMNFSPYTLSGHSFTGGGVELSPRNWRFALMAGRMKKAVNYDQLNKSSVVPSYRRMGYGLKVGYEKGSGSISSNIFTASDIENSIYQLPTDGSLHPMQNLAIGLSGRTALFKHIVLQGEYSLSILNGDTRMTHLQEDSTAIQPNNNPLSESSPGTRKFDAYSFGIGVQSSSVGIIIKYERVAPDYQTLGAYYFNNDLENLTIAPTFSLFEGRLSFTGNGGLQQNNLDKSCESTTKRWVGAGNLSFNPSEKWNIGANYSNFSTYTRTRPLIDPFFQNEMDSLNYYQVTNQMGSLINFTFGKKEAPHSIILNTSYQVVAETTVDTLNHAESGFISANASYSHQFTKTGMTLALSYNMNLSNSGSVQTFYQGPSLSLNKTFSESGLRLSFNSAWNQSLVNRSKSSPVLLNGLNFVYTPKKESGGNHSVTGNINLLQRLPSETQKKIKTELTATLNYSFAF